MMREQSDPELAELRYHWGEAYQITREHGMCRAVRRDDGSGVTATNVGRLTAEIRADYQARPVPREGNDQETLEVKPAELASITAGQMTLVKPL